MDKNTGINNNLQSSTSQSRGIVSNSVQTISKDATSLSSTDIVEHVPQRHPTISFDDGNIVVATATYYFLVHLGVLCRQSTFFVNISQYIHKDSAKRIEGRPVLALQESSSDMANFLTALYDGITSFRYNAHDFSQVSAVLRLATKYHADRIRSGILEHMSTCWPSTLSKWDNRERLATDSAGLYSPRPIFPHPILVINLAREVEAPQLLPSAFYDLSRYLPSQMVAGYTSTNMTLSGLSNENILITLKGKESAARFLSTFIVSELEGREASQWCIYRLEKDPERRRACRVAFEAVTFELLRDMHGLVCNRNSDPLYAIAESHGMQTRSDIPGSENRMANRACESCRLELLAAVTAARNDFWMKLPVWFEVEVAPWGTPN